jgi:hypothetical protein
VALSGGDQPIWEATAMAAISGAISRGEQSSSAHLG